VVPVLLIAAAVLLISQYVAPWLHNVPDNPLAGLLQSPRDRWLFAIVALVAGGVREEVQRAFLLTRFEQHLGGARVGLIVTSVAFGLGHLLQGSTRRWPPARSASSGARCICGAAVRWRPS
jgi:membrane protease YdiL (CAAX protease family)